MLSSFLNLSYTNIVSDHCCNLEEANIKHPELGEK